MDTKDLFAYFQSEYLIPDKILMITPSEFHKLEGLSIENCRMLMLVCEGSLTFEADKKVQEMGAHTMLDVLERNVMRFESISKDAKIYGLLPLYSFVEESLKSLKPGPERGFINRKSSPVLHMSEEEHAVMVRQMELIEACFRNTKHYYRQELLHTYFKSFMLEMGNFLLTHEEHADNENSTPTISKAEWTTLTFMKLVWEHFKEEHTVDFYANELCISPKHLGRTLKETIDKTPHEIIRDELLHHAMELLEDESYTIQQIAETLSFSDQASFCKFFKKYKNSSPSLYRKRIVKI